MKALLAWLEDRTGVASLLHAALYEHVPGGARWRYVWGSTLVFAFFVQMVTGVFLWMCYSPSGDSAWESVYFIQYHLQGGWLLRGLHHYMAQAMVVLLALHLMQVVVDGAYRAPREVNFWLGMALMQIVLGLSLTGYLLPWDEKGYWATRVATNLMGVVPLVGEKLQALVVGGSEYGSYTLTRFFALHAGVLPALLIFFLVLHVALFRRHGLTVKQPLRRPDATFWPDQVLKDAVACLAVLVVVLVLIVRPVLSGQHTFAEATAAEHPGDYLGADLGAPADPASQYSAARPEWYFLFLFQFLKLFSGYGERGELMGAIVIPGAVMLLVFLMPLVGRWKLGRGFNIGLLACLMLGVLLLTVQAVWDDNLARWVAKPEASEGSKLTSKEKKALARYEASQAYLKAVEESEETAARARELAGGLGIPPQGAISLVRDDPKTQGPKLFATNCLMCHSYTDPLGRGMTPEKASASNLYGFASRKWLAGLLDPKEIVTPAYFGATKHKEGEMVGFVAGEDFAKVSAADKVKVVMALSAQAHLESQRDADAADAAAIAAGTELIKAKVGCIDCHRFAGEGDLGTAPELTGYGSREWLSGMIGDPNHERYYGEKNDRMPAFAPSDKPADNRLSRHDVELLADWLRGQWYEPEAAASD
jgi:quinol-cytochrome oxidoreductase complex cytochrome b subunit/mono/diheme cytochrome c family protein